MLSSNMGFESPLWDQTIDERLDIERVERTIQVQVAGGCGTARQTWIQQKSHKGGGIRRVRGTIAIHITRLACVDGERRRIAVRTPASVGQYAVVSARIGWC